MGADHTVTASFVSLVRSGMSNLIARLRAMVDDGATPQRFTDLQLQDYLDQYRYRVAGEYLCYDVDRLVYELPFSNLEEDAVLKDAALNVISSGSYTANYVSGSFTFATDPLNTPRVWGYAYDIHAAAADAWTTKAANSSVWKGQFGLLAMQTINMHRRLAWGRNSDLSRI